MIEDGYTYVDCNQIDKFLPLEFMFEERYLAINPRDYIWDSDGDGEVCTLLLRANEYDFFVLGQPIYQGWYFMHNIKDATITLAPLKDSGKSLPPKTRLPIYKLNEETFPSFIKMYGA